MQYQDFHPLLEVQLCIQLLETPFLLEQPALQQIPRGLMLELWGSVRQLKLVLQLVLKLVLELKQQGLVPAQVQVQELAQELVSAKEKKGKMSKSASV